MKKKIMPIIVGILSCIIFFISSCTKTPSACFSADKGQAAKVNEEVQFDASCSTNATSYTWDFGDGASTSGNPVKHKYATPGTYAVKLTATNKKKTGTATQNLVINL